MGAVYSAIGLAHELTPCLQEDGHIVPGRFQQVVGFHDYSVQSQHPCYTTSSRDLGKKKPQVINQWQGHPSIAS